GVQPPPGSDLRGAVMPDVARRRGRGLRGDRLGAVAGLAGLDGRRLFLAADTLLEGRQALAEIAHQLRDLAATAKQQQHDGQHDEPMPYAEATHVKMLPDNSDVSRSPSARLARPIMAPRRKTRQHVE